MKNVQKIKTGLNILTNTFTMLKKIIIIMKNGKNAETKINNAHNVIDITQTANCTKYLAYTQPQYNEIYYTTI